MALSNPYVGPDPIAADRRLYGRDTEVADVRDLLIAERIILLYSPSGAGKTSLIQAGLLHELRDKEGFRVLLVRGFRSGTAAGLHNRYLASVIETLQNVLSPALRARDDMAAGTPLDAYLKRRPRDPQEGPASASEQVLIFDQFEEVLTLDPFDREAKTAFFRELGTVLKDRSCWALFSMREDHVAELDNYLHLLPTALKKRYRLELLGQPQALEAIIKPAQDLGVKYEAGAADLLVNDLCKIRYQTEAGVVEERLGHWVEPVQLQVACLQLWEHRFPQPFQLPATIAAEHVRAISVDRALEDFYTEKVQAAASAAHVPERDVREWIEEQLITPHGIRGQVLWEPEKSGGLANNAIQVLEDAHVVRLEARGERKWYELTHDRMIRPVQKNNAEWFQANLSTLQRQAALWKEQHRSAGLLLRSEALEEAEGWANTHKDVLTTTEHDFLAACQADRALARRERRINHLIRGLAIALLLSLSYVSYDAYSSWVEIRPWGYLRNLSTGKPHQLQGTLVSIGRSVKDFENTINLQSQVVSRIHLFITRDLKANDMRSMNGTMVNAEFLPYGRSQELQSGDVIVLAGEAPFQLETIKYSSLQFWPPEMKSSSPPSGWGMLIDGASKTIYDLRGNAYFLSVDVQNRIILQENETPDTLLAIRIDNARGIIIENLEDPTDLLVRMKWGDYTYVECKLPSDRGFDKIIVKEDYLQQCKFFRSRSDYIEDARGAAFPLSQVTFKIKGIPFQIVPVVSDLEPNER